MSLRCAVLYLAVDWLTIFFILLGKLQRGVLMVLVFFILILISPYMLLCICLSKDT